MTVRSASMPRARFTRLVVSAALVMGTITVAPLAATSAQAAPGKPVLTVSGGSSRPTVSWGDQLGVYSYVVNWLSESGAVLEGPITTFNRVATPTIPLPAGARVSVAAYDVDLSLSATTEVPLGITKPAAPTITSPLGNEQPAPGTDSSNILPTVEYPHAPVLGWNRVERATRYEVKYSSGEDQRTVFTRSLSYVPTEVLTLASEGADKQWTWQVRAWANENVLTDFSAESKFRMIWPTNPLDFQDEPGGTQTRKPADDADLPVDLPTTPAVTDTALSWKPVPGALQYNLQLSTDKSFADPLRIRVDVTSVSSRYSPPTDLPNGSYFWRVRAQYPSAAQFGEWSEVWTFQRKWGFQTAPGLDPLGGSEITQLARPSVVAPDSGLGSVIDGVWTPSPVSVPVNELALQWTAVARANRYEVQFATSYDPDTGLVAWPGESATCITYQTRLTFADAISRSGLIGGSGNCLTALPAVGATVLWRVRAVDANGLNSLYSTDAYSGDTARPSAFTVAAASGVPVILSTWKQTTLTQTFTPVTESPLLQWDRVIPKNGDPEYPGYYVDFGADEAFTQVVATYYTSQNQLVPADDLYDNQAGSGYYWRVRPKKGDTVLSASDVAAPGFFSKSSVQTVWASTPSSANPVTDPATGQAITFVESNTTRTRTKSTAGDQFVLNWKPRAEYAPTASLKYYTVQISTSPIFATALVTAYVSQPFYVGHTSLLPSTETGRYYARVQAVSGGSQGAPWSPTISFTKSAPTVTNVSATTGTSCETREALTSFLPQAPLLCWNPAAFTQGYDVQVLKGGVQVVRETAKYAAYVPAGLGAGSYTWRVRRIDTSGNAPSESNSLGWATGGAFTIASPPPAITTLAGGSSFKRTTETISWSAVPAANSYRLDIAISGTGFASLSYSVSTRNLSHALTTQLAYDGRKYDMRIVPIDLSGEALSVSQVVSFGMLTPPGAIPTPTYVAGADGTSFRLSWNPPLSGGSAITRYAVRNRVSGTQAWSTPRYVGASDGTLIVTGLRRSTSYQVQVVPQNSIGYGYGQVWEIGSTATLPSTVANCRVTSAGPGAAKVIWDAATDGGSPLRFYQISVQRGSSAPVYKYVGKVNGVFPLTTTLTGVPVGKSVIKVRAVNGVGVGGYCTQQSVSVAGIPSLPKLTYTVGDRRVTAAWTYPSTVSAPVLLGVQLSLYTRASAKAAWSRVVTKNISSASKTHLLTGLTRGRQYQIRVATRVTGGVSTPKTVTFTAR